VVRNNIVPFGIDYSELTNFNSILTIDDEDINNYMLSLIETTSKKVKEEFVKNVLLFSNSDEKYNRSNLRISNIIDMNIVPINLHSLMREVPFINLNNYSYTFDKMLANIFYIDETSNKNIKEHSIVDDSHELMVKLLKYPLAHYCVRSDVPINLLEDAANTNQNGHFMREFIMILAIMRGASELNDDIPKYLEDQLGYKILLLENKKTLRIANTKLNRRLKNLNHRMNDQLSMNRDLIRANIPAPYVNPLLQVSPTAIYLFRNDESVKYSIDRFNTKLFRNMFWITNIQRLIRTIVSRNITVLSTNPSKGISMLNQHITNYDDNDEDMIPINTSTKFLKF